MSLTARNPILDAWRCAAITLVLCHHCVLPTETSGRLRPVVEPLARFGWTGVDLFFVLSGLLIGSLLFGELNGTGTLDVKRFLVRRAFKIWPGYFAYIGYVLIYEAFVRRKIAPASVARSMIPNFVHLQNYFITPRVHTWSLAVEEHFYLALPILLLLIARQPARRVAMILMSAIGAVVVWRCGLLIAGDGENAYFRTDCRIDGLLFGVLLAHLVITQRDRLQLALGARRALAITGVVLIAPMLFVDKQSAFVRSIGFTMLYLGYGALILASGFLDAPRAPGNLLRLTARVGGVSYATYLWFEDLGRTPVGILTNRGLGVGLPREVRWIAAQLIYTMLAFAAGAAATRIVERPALALRERLFPSRRVVSRLVAP